MCRSDAVLLRISSRAHEHNPSRSRQTLSSGTVKRSAPAHSTLCDRDASVCPPAITLYSQLPKTLETYIHLKLHPGYDIRWFARKEFARKPCRNCRPRYCLLRCTHKIANGELLSHPACSGRPPRLTRHCLSASMRFAAILGLAALAQSASAHCTSRSPIHARQLLTLASCTQISGQRSLQTRRPR